MISGRLNPESYDRSKQTVLCCCCFCFKMDIWLLPGKETWHEAKDKRKSLNNWAKYFEIFFMIFIKMRPKDKYLRRRHKDERVISELSWLSVFLSKAWLCNGYNISMPYVDQLQLYKRNMTSVTLSFFLCEQTNSNAYGALIFWHIFFVLSVLWAVESDTISLIEKKKFVVDRPSFGDVSIRFESTEMSSSA